MQEPIDEIVRTPPKEGEPMIFRVQMPAHPSVDSVKEMWREVLRFAEAVDGVFVLIVDARLIQPRKITALHRKATSDFFRTMEERFSGAYLGDVLVFGSAFQRGVLTAVTWIYKPSWPREVCSSLEVAEGIAKARLSSSAR